MPLSDHEQRLLDEIEQALYAEDPKFAASVRSARTRSRTRRAVALMIAGVLVGLACVLVGLVVPIIALSVVGFVLVVVACGYGIQAIRGRDRSPGAPTSSSPAPDPKQSGLRGRMEDKLRRRFEES